ncbi:right-handed parallel beta-helix repeat-containing protein, partial [Candidatus Pacearchaeota archaeon]|nr:right-handed parallel beta-helix repeat-containing protein [Candidatus Pacearchaeota archaeon]
MRRGARAVSRIEEYRKRIFLAEQQRKKIIRLLQELKDKCWNREISQSEYEQKTNEKYEGRTLKEWIEHYEKDILECRIRIQYEEAEIRRRKILSFIFISLGVLVLVAILSYGRSLTGFAIKSDEVYTDSINQQFTESSIYVWQPQHDGTLTSLKISGTIEGEGTAKVYLNDRLILDTSNQKKKFSITGAVIGSPEDIPTNEGEVPQTPSQTEPLSQGNQTETSSENTTNNVENTSEENTTISENTTITSSEFSDICEETCDLSKEELSEKNYNIRVELDGAHMAISSISYTTIPSKSQNNTNQTSANQTSNISLEEFIQGPAEVGKPVVWKKEVHGKKDLVLPKQAEKIKANKIGLEDEVKCKENNKQEDKELSCESSDYEISYETPAPTLTQEVISPTHKRITIHGPETIHYSNVSSSESISETADVNSIKLYWIVNGTRQEHPFTAKDTNNNSLIDTIEWVVPHLSDQVFEIIIITKAEHLDQNKSFISEIYGQVHALDGVWSESIPDTHYVRITFERSLTKDNDISIYPRVISGTPKIEVYEKDKDILITQFADIQDNQYNKHYLSGLQGIQDTFDLRIVGGTVEFDHIIDPSTGFLVPNPTNNPGTNGTLTETTFTLSTSSTTSNAITAKLNISDNSCALFTGSATVDAFVIVNFTIPAYASINRILITAESNVTATDRKDLALFNFSSSKWLRVNTSLSAANIENVSYFNITSALVTNFVSNNIVQVMVYANGTASNNLCVDFISANVTYEQSPVVTLRVPANGTTVSIANMSFNGTFTDDTGLSNATLYIWNSTSLVNTTFRAISSTGNSTNITVILPRAGTYFWNYRVADTQNNYAFATNNYTLIYQSGDTTPPQVTILSPENRTYVRLQGVPFVFNVSLNENGSVSYSFDGGVTNISMLGNEGVFGTLFNDTNESLAEGNYIFTVYANDTAGNRNSTEKVFFSRQDVNVLVNSTVTDADGNLINSTVMIIASDGTTLYNQTSETHEQIVSVNDTYDVVIKPLDISSVDQIVFADLNLSDYAGNSVNMIDIDETTNVSETDGFDKIFALDPQIENFTSATVTIQATGNTIYKCIDWDYNNRTCLGTWDIFLTDLVPGELYNFTLTPGDPGYGIINIVRAQHLDDNRLFISDIYNDVKDLDGVWSESIPDTHYVRITFERNLTQGNDITIYPRIVSGTPTVQVYEMNGTDMIMEFTNIQENQYNTLIIPYLSGSQDTFDLRVVGGTVEFDHITDPSTGFIVPNGGTSPAQNGSLSEQTFTFSTASASPNNVYTQLNKSDDNCSLFLGSATVDAFVVVNFTIPTFATLSSAFITSESNVTTATDHKNLAIWNFSSLAWFSANNSVGAANTENVTTFNVTSAMALNFIANGTMRVILRENGTASSNLCVDFMSVNVTYEQFPVVNLRVPTNGTTTGISTMSFNGTFTDDTGLSNATLYIWNSTSLVNTTFRAISSTGNSSNITFVFPRGDTYFWNYYVADTLNNYAFNATNFTITYDATPPIVTINQPPFATNTLPISFNVTLNENGTACNYTLNSGVTNISMTNNGNRDFNATNVSIANGTYTVTYYCWDSVNNLNNTATRAFIFDQILPYALFNSPLNNTNLTTAPSAALNFSIFDNNNHTEIFVYASNDSVNIYDYLVYHSIDQPNGTIILNWSAPALRADNFTVLLLHFDNLSAQGENITNAKDFSTPQNNATLQSIFWNATGKVAGSLTFDGVLSDNNVSVLDSADFDMKSYTVMGWIYLLGNGTSANTGSGLAYPIIGKGVNEAESTAADIQFFVGVNTTSGALMADFENDSGSTGGGQNAPLFGATSLSLGQWYHFAYTVENWTNASLYLNGILEANRSIVGMTPNIRGGTMKVGIGQVYTTAGAVNGAWNGSIDEIVIFNKSLPSEAIANAYNLSVGLKYWRINVTDSSGNKNGTPVYVFNLSSPDLAAPRVTVNLPQNQTYHALPILFNITLNENATCNFTLNSGVNNFTMQQNGITDFNASNGSIANGGYTVNYYCVDLSNNVNSSTSVIFSVIVDTSAPAISFVNPTPSAGSTQSATAIFVNVTSNDSSVHYSFVDFDRDLKLWLRMDDINSTGGVIDLSTWSNNATNISGAFQNKFGYFNSSYTFDGIDDYLEIPSSPSLYSNGSFTLSAWVNTRSVATGEHKYILDMGRARDSGTGLFLDDAASRFSFYYNDSASDYIFSFTPATNTWYHVVGTYNGTLQTLYVNGVYNGSRNVTPLSWVDKPVRIGAEAKTVQRFWNGSIDEVLIFNRSLTSTEVLALYNAGANQYSRNFTNLTTVSHTFTGYSVDTSGNKNQTGQRTVTIGVADTTPPVVNITVPTNITYTTSSFVFNVSLNESGTVLFTLNGGVTNYTMTTPDNIHFNYTNSSIRDGSYTFQVYSNDTSGNRNDTASVVFSIDATPPVVLLISPPNGSSTKIGVVGFLGNFTDNIQLKNTTLYIWNSTSVVNTTFREVNGTTNSTNISVTLPRFDTYFWNYLAVDTAGNLAWNATNFTITYDPTTLLNGCQNISSPGSYAMTRSLNNSDLGATGCFIINASNVDFDCKSFSIQNITLEASAIYVDTVENATIKNCKVRMAPGTEGYGVRFSNSNNSLVLNTTATNTYHGIFFESGNNNRVNGSTINFNTEGITANDNTLLNISRSSLSSNTIGVKGSASVIFNTFGGHTTAISTSGSASVIRDNLFSEDTDGIVIAISATVVNNTFTDMAGRIIDMSSATNSLIANNSLSSGTYGIFLGTTASFNVIDNNVILAPATAGIFFDTNPLNNNVTRNTISSSGGDGISSDDMGTNLFVSNIIQASTNNGILVSSSGRGIFINNTLVSNGGYGLKLDSSISTHTIVTGNNISYNSLGGIYLPSTNNNITLNTINSNSVHGLELVGNENNITLNTINSNNQSGVYSSVDSSHNIILSNTINSNRQYGIYFVDSNINNTITANSLFNNSAGIFINSSSNNTFVANIINSTYRGAAVNITGINARFNNLSFNITNTNISYPDLLLSATNFNNTYIIDSYIANYSFGVSGGIVYFKSTLYGEIRFLRSINGSGSNLSNDIRFENNNVTVNITSNIGLNRTANVTLFGLSTGFLSPQIFRNGIVCIAPSCNNFTSLNAGNVSFNVTGWSTYSIGEFLTNTINFTNPTPANGSTQTSDSIFVNVTSTNVNLHYTFVDFDRSLRLWLRMDDRNSTGGIIDLSSWGNNATNVSGAFPNSTGKFNSSYTFDGVDDYLEVPYSQKLYSNTSFTFSAWFLTRNNAATGNSRYILDTGFAGDAGAGLYLDDSARISFYYNDSGGNAVFSFVPNTDQWYHVVGTYNGSLQTLYVNGIFNGSKNTTPTDFSKFGNFNVLIGARARDTSKVWNGSIDEVMIFNRSLTSTEVLALYDDNIDHAYNNFTSLPAGDHIFTGYSVDTLGVKNQTEQRTVHISLTNTAPTIPFVTPVVAQDPTEDSVTNVIINFTAFDPDGFGDLKDASSRVNVSFTGLATVRQNLSCSRTSTFATNYANYTCLVNMWYFDSSGSWNISVSINDTSNTVGINQSTVFTYNQLSAFVSGPSGITFAQITPGATNSTATNDPLVLNNTGNKNITLGNVQMNATNLKGETDANKALY